jgi:curli biogenesis system outer membrane secretion channel CsgG
MTKRLGLSLMPMALIALLLAGCVTSPHHYNRSRRGPSPRNKEILRSTVAVTDFENRANFNGQWNLGSGFADVLVTHLIDTDRVVVLERKYIRNVMGELDLQGDQRFRPEGRVTQGKLKNAQYLIRGAITDFSVTGDVSGWFGIKSAAAKAGGSRARVALHITISDVETGEILTSVKSTGSASSSFIGGRATYSSMAFGGDAFFRTPLGKATDEAMRKAIHRIIQELPVTRWDARIADADPSGGIIVNGGENVGLSVGTLFDVRGPARQITDPATGNVIETIPGRTLGRIQLQEIKPYSSRGILLSGEALRGDLLIKVDVR